MVPSETRAQKHEVTSSLPKLILSTSKMTEGGGTRWALMKRSCALFYQSCKGRESSPI